MQGYSNYNIVDNNVSIKDGANLDAFSRLRVSNPLILHSCQFTYDLAPVLFEQITDTGATISHNTTDRCANITFTSVTNGEAYMQSYEYFAYQPGRSQLIFITFNFNLPQADIVKFAGYSDGVNGIELQLTDTFAQFSILSNSGNGNQTVKQDDWNLDKLDGTGPSGITIDFKSVQILVIDIQALYVGRVRIGFDIGGKIIYAHEFLHANLTMYPYIQYASLPVRCGMSTTGTAVSGSMKFICSAVISEGGSEDINVFGYTFETNTSASVGTTEKQIMTLRPKLTFNSITNRMKFAFIDVEMYNKGNQPVRWNLYIGQDLKSGGVNWADVNTTYSGIEVATGEDLQGTPAIRIDGGWIPGSGSTKGFINNAVISKYPITLDAAGANRVMGSITLTMTSTSGTQAMLAGMKFREIR